MALQMSWQPSLLHHKRKNGAPLGLRNLGNSCYLNSVLQCLTYTPPLANFCLKNQHSSLCDSATEPNKKRDCPFCILERRIARSLTFDLTLDSPAKIVNSLRIYAEHFQCGRQEDAHEFLRYVIDACHNTCLRLKKLQQCRKGSNGVGKENLGKTIVSDIFGGTLQNQVKCLSCGAESNKVDEMMDLSLDILHSSSLKESMQKFFQPEILDGNNKYKCDKCNKLVAARKQMSILQAPNVLVVQLKRFEGIFGRKIDKAIDFEENLFLSGFMCKANQVKNPRNEYSLFGTIVHSGFSPESGHYYAYIKDAMGRWFCCNDSCVTQSSVQEVLSERAYILFFARTNQKAAASPTSIVSNGLKSHDSNGNGAVKILKNVLPHRAVKEKPSVEPSLAKSTSTEAKVDKVSFSFQTKFNGLAGSVSVKTSVSGNGQVDSLKIQSAKENDGRNGQVDSLKIQPAKENNGHDGQVDSLKIQPAKENNGHNGQVESLKSHPVQDNNGCNGQVDSLKIRSAKENNGCNGHVYSHKIQPAKENNGHLSNIIQQENGQLSAKESGSKLNVKNDAVNGDNGHGLVNRNGHVYSHDGVGESAKKVRQKNENNGAVNGAQSNATVNGYVAPSLKRKEKESQSTLEEFKEALHKEAISVLHSCGWTDEVYEYMRSKKRLRAGDLASLTADESKNLLIEDARTAFQFKVPPSLKQGLITRLRSFTWDL